MGWFGQKNSALLFEPYIHFILFEPYSPLFQVIMANFFKILHHYVNWVKRYLEFWTVFANQSSLLLYKNNP